MICNLCPRNCNVDRSVSLGVCKTDNIIVSRVARHNWEEPCISGQKGSGTIFFAGCNLHCRFCQNYDISVNPHGAEVTYRRLADIMLYLQDTGVANINLVTPTHFSDKICQALSIVKQRLNIPVVYNTSSYEKVEALQKLDGLVDVYLPDLKFCSKTVSRRLANAADYFAVATAAIGEMRRQQPCEAFDEQGYIKRGMIVRHLVLPSYVEDSKLILDWIADFDKNLYISLMSQYFVARLDGDCPELNRKLFKHEYENIKNYFYNLGLTHGYFQDIESATKDYLPSFDESEIGRVLKTVPHVFTESAVERN